MSPTSKVLLSAAALALTLGGCQRDDTVATTPPTDTTIITPDTATGTSGTAGDVGAGSTEGTTIVVDPAVTPGVDSTAPPMTYPNTMPPTTDGALTDETMPAPVENR
jgi:hypothetical protein